MKCSGFLLKTIWFCQTNLVSSKETRANQLLSITHEIYKSFDKDFEVRGVLLDISKAFDKVWPEGIIFKIKQNGISSKLLNVLSDFLKKIGSRELL